MSAFENVNMIEGQIQLDHIIALPFEMPIRQRDVSMFEGLQGMVFAHTDSIIEIGMCDGTVCRYAPSAKYNVAISVGNSLLHSPWHRRMFPKSPHVPAGMFLKPRSSEEVDAERRPFRKPCGS
ncbi:MAG: hypothetical protein ACLUUF_06845 [Bifidobacterium pullorum]